MTLDCPGCGAPPFLLLGRQAFCGSPSCKVVTWNPTKTLDENLDDFGVLDLSFLDGETPEE